MTGRGRWVDIAVTLLVCVSPVALHAQDDEAIGIGLGTTPPAVQIEDLAGWPVDLAQYVGKRPVLIEFWATWCPLCAALFPKLETAAQRHAGQIDVVVVAVAVNQSKTSIARHLVRHPMPFARVLWDTDGRATRAFQAPSTSYIVALDARGRVVYTGLGEDQNVEGAVKRAVEGGRGR